MQYMDAKSMQFDTLAAWSPVGPSPGRGVNHRGGDTKSVARRRVCVELPGE